MTAQINDTFRYQGNEYALAGISEGELFDPALLDLKPVGTCTACYRGYRAVFALADFRLVLDELHVQLFEEGQDCRRIAGPQINGVRPTGEEGEDDWFNNHYRGLNYHLEYSGGLLLADGFIEELYVHMGFHPAWKYETVVELLFEGGTLKKATNRSIQMADIRARVAESGDEDAPVRMLTRDEIAEFVERAFDRRYEL